MRFAGTSQLIKVALIWVLMVVPVEAATVQQLISQSFDRPSPSVAEFNYLFHIYESLWNPSEIRNNIVPNAGTISNLNFDVDTAPGGSESYTFVVFQNGSTSGYGCTISGAAITCDASGSLDIAQADLITLRVTPSAGTPADPVIITWVLNFTPDDEDNYFYHGGSGGFGIGSDSGPGGSGIQGDLAQAGGTFSGDDLIPFSGTIKNLHVQDISGPGVGKTRTFTLEVNDSLTSLTCNLTGSSTTTCSDTSNSVAVVEGDEVGIHWVGDPVGSGFDSSLYETGVTFVSGVTGQYPRMAHPIQTVGKVSETFFPPQGTRVSPNATESIVQFALDGILISKMLVKVAIVSQTPNGDFTFTLRVNGVDTALSCAVCLTLCSGTDSDCDVTSDVTIVDDDLLSVKVVSENTGVNANVDSKYSFAFGEADRRFYRTY